MLCLRTWQCLGECIRSHIVHWAINKFQQAVFDDEPNKMISDVDVFHTRMKVSVGGDGDGGLVIAVESCR